jgi:hypothetical protein
LALFDTTDQNDSLFPFDGRIRAVPIEVKNGVVVLDDLTPEENVRLKAARSILVDWLVEIAALNNEEDETQVEEDSEPTPEPQPVPLRLEFELSGDWSDE